MAQSPSEPRTSSDRPSLESRVTIRLAKDEVEALLAYYPTRGGLSKVIRALVHKHIKRLNVHFAEQLEEEDFR